MTRRAFQLLAGLLFSILVAEMLLRCLPVSTGYTYQPLNDSNPVLRGQPFVAYTYSRAWNFRLTTSGTLNNDGFIASRNYGLDDKERILLLGDSFVQAAAVQPDRNLHARLSDRLAGADVYGLGRAGGALPDYLAMAKWGIEKYRPRVLVFQLVRGDVGESLAVKAGGYHFQAVPQGYAMGRTDRLAHSRLGALAGRSMLFHYLYDNLAVTVNFPRRLLGKRRGPKSRLQFAERANISAFFLESLADMFPPERVVLLLSGVRTGETLVEDADLQRLGALAASRGFKVIDLADSFNAFEKRTGHRVDFSPFDTHWNETAHALVAAELSPLLEGML